MNAAIALCRSEDGQGSVEYALLAVFVSITAFVLLSVIGVDVMEFFDVIEDATGDSANGNEPVNVSNDDDASEATGRP